MQEYKARIRLKSDTEANWIALNSSLTGGFIPLAGELIIYSADNTHSYCRLKVGDGVNSVTSLPFIDAGTINGEETEIVKLNNLNERPQPGSPDKLYVDLSTNKIYHYDANSGYTQLSNFTFNITKTDVSKITSWSSGIMTELTIDGTILKVKKGVLPELLYYNTQAVSDVTRE